MRKLFLFVFFISFIGITKAQVLQGKIVDEVTGVGIPFASIGIIGTNNATVTNETGGFILRVSTYPAKLRFSHVSYLLAEIIITESSNDLIVKLKPATISLSEVTIDPFKGQRIVKAALEKAIANQATNFYTNAFYRQLTTLNNKPNQIYELFYDLKWNAKGIQGWIAKQSRLAEQHDQIAFSFDNQSYFTFSFGGQLSPERKGKLITLTNLNEYEIVIEKYIEQPAQNIAVISCKYKSTKKNQFYVNTTYYIGIDNLNIYRLENSLFNLPMRFSGASKRYPPLATTISTFNGNDHIIPVLESISTKLQVSLSVSGQENNSTVQSLLTVYNIDENLKKEQFQNLNIKTKDKKVRESIKYDAIFWKNNPIVKQTTLEDSFIKMMESKQAFGTMTNP
ncbi:hypothetical protein GM921_06785 [Pedobacter sp. LMG 31464]|uniref:CarboxypepD_reg-like domain-containing protein n=1 Tax=Pedobacter planticolens TaxID=2679964 RepID=A0A923DY43_9SPHI|nr:carboxypeptidase-like regulatory domain-containing protein [Pedobacter planticolens]MBB2145181.1 hypothetical protein [Pedobacter planticolens]